MADWQPMESAPQGMIVFDDPHGSCPEAPSPVVDLPDGAILIMSRPHPDDNGGN